MLSLSFSTLIVILAAALALAGWQAGAAARETANRVAADACRRRSLQLLDGTVALAGLRLRLRPPSIERTYVFDYAPGRDGRASGFIIMVGREVRHVGFESDASA